MRKTSISKTQDPEMVTSEHESDEMLPEYNFDYRKSRPNRYAAQMKSDSVLVVLEPDIAEIFTTSEAVNQVLRALIVTMPSIPQHS